MQRITKSTIAKIDPAKEIKERDLVDAEIRGFGVRIRPEKDPTFYFRYQSPKLRKIRRLSMGSVRDVELETAREIAREYRGYIVKGIDPADARRRPSLTMTVRQLYDRYLLEHVRVKNKPRTARDVHYLWTRFILPAWGEIPVSSITRADALKLISSVKSKTSSNRVRAYISKAFNLAELWEIRPNGSNPCRHIPKYREEIRDRVVMPNEIQALWKALDAHQETDQPTVTLARLMLLTGARWGELAAAKVEDVDLNQKILRLPDSKTGKASIELTDEAIEVIGKIQRWGGSKYLIPGYYKGQPLRSPYTAWRKIVAYAGLSDLRLHDLRHVFGTYAHHSGANQRQIKDLLRHSTFQMSERYIQGFQSERRRAAEQTVKTILGFKDDTSLDVRTIDRSRD